MPDASPAEVSAVIVAGGDPVDAAVLPRLPHRRYVIAADSGLDHAMRLGLEPDIVIGDMDSVAARSLAQAADRGVAVVAHPRDKDATDLELAIDHARVRGHHHVVVLGGYGGRTSHLLGNALVLTAPAFAGMRIEWHVGSTTVMAVRPDVGANIIGAPGDLVSLLATGGPAAGVTTTGLRWPLTDEALTPGSTRGISNTMHGDRVTVALRSGALLAVHERNRP